MTIFCQIRGFDIIKSNEYFIIIYFLLYNDMLTKDKRTLSHRTYTFDHPIPVQLPSHRVDRTGYFRSRVLCKYSSSWNSNGSIWMS